jgi:hypothetical protein
MVEIDPSTKLSTGLLALSEFLGGCLFDLNNQKMTLNNEPTSPFAGFCSGRQARVSSHD